eukprot:UN09848
MMAFSVRKRKTSKFVWKCTKCQRHQLKPTHTCKECKSPMMLRLKCKCGAMHDTHTHLCPGCSKCIEPRTPMREKLLQEDVRQIGVFLSGCFNINSYQKNLSLLFDGYMGHNTYDKHLKLYERMPEDVMRVIVSFYLNLQKLESIMIIIKEGFKDEWNTYPYTSNIAKLNKHPDPSISQIWVRKNEITYNTMRKVWKFKVSKSNLESNNTPQFSFTIGICKNDYTKNYEFPI